MSTNSNRQVTAVSDSMDTGKILSQSDLPGTIPCSQTVSSGLKPDIPEVSECALKPKAKVKSAEIPAVPVPISSKIRSAPAALVQARAAKRDYSAPVGKRLQTIYPLERPKGKFLRVHPSSDYRQMGVLTYRDEDSGETYYVSPDLDIPDSYGIPVKVTDLFAAVTHDGTYFVWPVNRSETSWYRSSRKAVQQCSRSWFKVVSKKGPNIYDLYTSEFPIPEPDWSGLPQFDEMLELAFDGRMIETLDHPVLMRARGRLDDDE